jgi:arylsulfatase
LNAPVTLQKVPSQDASHGRADEPRPNILLIMTDQHRWDALGCVGGWVKTPHLDRLAAEGVRFSNAYTNAPMCVPARLSLARGRYPHHQAEWAKQPEGLRLTWMRAVRDAGYSTSVIGKTHLHRHEGHLRDREHLLHAYGLDHVDEIADSRGSALCRSNLTDRWEEAGVYDDYKRDFWERAADKPWVARPSPLPLELYGDVYVGQQAAAYLRGYDGAKPWFCWASFGGPHEPWDAPEPYASAYDPAAMPKPVLPQELGHDRPRGLLDKKLAKGFQFEPGDIARLRANYAGKVTLIDDQVGEVLRAVEDRGELDRTVVAFVSDHGEMNGDYNLIFKQTFLNAAVRIPFIVRLPPHRQGATAGAVAGAVVELMDLGATLVELAGARQVPGSLARSVVPVLEDPSLPHRQVALSEMRRSGEVMIATADWKMALNREREVYLLYDLRADPSETRNVAGLPDYKEVERDLRRHLDETLEATR